MRRLKDVYGGVTQEQIDYTLRNTSHSITPETHIADIATEHLFRFQYWEGCPVEMYRAMLDRITSPTDEFCNFPGDMIQTIARMPANLLDDDIRFRFGEIMAMLDDVLPVYEQWKSDPKWGPYNGR